MVKHFEFDEELKLLHSEVSSISELMEEIRREWCNTNLKDCPEADKISQCIMQMITLKIQSVLQLSNGVPLPSYQPQPIFLDSASIVALLRCIYEEVFIFHNIFATESGMEKSILIDLWKIKGLNNMIFEGDDQSINFDGKKEILDKYYEAIERNKEKIDLLKVDIDTILLQMDITVDAANKVRNYMNKGKRSIKGYKFKKENGRVIDFTKIDFAVSPEEVFASKKLNPLYRFLSVHSHPSYMGVEQFGQIYNTKNDVKLLKMTFRGICVMASIFINDFCKTVTNGNKISERIPERIKHKLSSFSQVDKKN